MRCTSRFARFGVAAATLWIAAPAAGQKTFKDPRYGFQLVVPKDFRQVPINMDEKWVVAKFLYKRSLEPKNSVFWVEKTPELRVIIFPKVDVKEVIAARKKNKKVVVREKGKDKVINLLAHLQNPFRSYKEYLRENYKKGGWFVKDEKKTTIGGLPAVQKVITVEDKMGYGGKGTLFAWEIDYGDAIYVVQFDVIADYDRKFKPAISKGVKAFKKTPRTEALRSKLTTSASEETKRSVEAASSKKKLSPAERKKARQSDLARAIDKAKQTLPDGWKWYQHGPFTVFYSSSLKFAKRVSKQANLMWKFMNNNFSYIGKDHSVGGILRICRNSAEASLYEETSSRSGRFTLTHREIVLCDDKDWGFNDSGSGALNQRILSQYLADKNSRLWGSLPPWLTWGMQLYIDSLKMKGNRLVSKPDEWDMDVIRKALREGKFKAAKELFVAKYDEFQATREDRVQCFAMVRSLMKSNKKKYKVVIHDYLVTLDEKLRELYAQKLDLTGAASEEAAGRVRVRIEWGARRQKVFDHCREAVFGSWNDHAWKAFDTQWRADSKR